jgi:hypothetical protein
MKNLLLVTFLLFGSITILQAQEQGDSRIHVLGQYGLRMDEPGIGLGWEYFFAPKFGLMPSYTQIFPAVGRSSNFSADLRYYLSEGKSQVYVISGYSLTTENTQPNTAGTRRKLSGANVGVGAVIPITDWVGLSTEFKFQSQGMRQTYFRFGLQFPLGK